MAEALNPVDVLITRVKYIEIYLSFDCPPGVPLPDIEDSGILFERAELTSYRDAVPQTEGIRLIIGTRRIYRGFIHSLGCSHVAHEELNDAFECARQELDRWLQRYKCRPVFHERDSLPEPAPVTPPAEQRAAMENGRLWVTEDGRVMVDRPED
jgi:hypothetical protein